MNFLIVRKLTGVSGQMAHWLNEVDRNRKFFHARAFERREQNTILGI